jgi:hypothetical protein
LPTKERHAAPQIDFHAKFFVARIVAAGLSHRSFLAANYASGYSALPAMAAAVNGRGV